VSYPALLAGTGVAAHQNRCAAAPVAMARLQESVSKKLLKNAVKMGTPHVFLNHRDAENLTHVGREVR
jgi:hypothetical protein